MGRLGSARLATAAASSDRCSDLRVFIDGIVIVGVEEGVTTRLTAPYEAVYVCVNGGGHVPGAENKMTLAGTSRRRRLPGGEERQGDGLPADGAAPDAG